MRKNSNRNKSTTAPIVKEEEKNSKKRIPKPPLNKIVKNGKKQKNFSDAAKQDKL